MSADARQIQVIELLTGPRAMIVCLLLVVLPVFLFVMNELASWPRVGPRLSPFYDGLVMALVLLLSVPALMQLTVSLFVLGLHW